MHRVSALALCTLATGLLMFGCGGKSYHESLQMAHFNYGEVLDGHMMRAEQAMMQVRDMDSARKAADRIALINQDIADVVYNAPRLSPEGQIELGKIAATHLTKVQRLKADIDRNPVLADVFGGDLEDMVGYLTVMVSGKYEDSPVD